MALHNGEVNKINNIFIVLVNPQMGENIGAIARVMHNFNIRNLRLVSPRDGWPNQKAISVSAKGSAIIDEARVYNNLKDAISDLHVVYACTARPRDMNKEVILPETAAEEAYKNITSKIGIVAGPENSGLNNYDISFCNKIITIPVSEEYKSINISQSIGIICYELFKRQLSKPASNISIDYDLVSKKDLDIFLENLITKLESKDFFKAEAKKERMIMNLRSIFERVTSLNSQDIKTLHGVVNSLSDMKITKK